MVLEEMSEILKVKIAYTDMKLAPGELIMAIKQHVINR